MAPKKDYDRVSVADDKGLLELRHYELEAYAAVVTALRAEGQLNEEKKNILKQLQHVLGISVGRHKAEVRRAVNDQKLASIALQIHGSSFDLEWQKEGRRLFGVLKRPTPITAYTKIADDIANEIWEENSQLNVADKKETSSKEPITIISPRNPDNYINDEISACLNNLSQTLRDESSDEENDLDVTYKGEKKGRNSQDNVCDSYVYLPSGTVVQLEPKPDVPKPLSDTGVPNPNSESSLHSKRHKKSSDLDDETSFVIKEVYKPEFIEAYKRQKEAQKQHNISKTSQSHSQKESASTLSQKGSYVLHTSKRKSQEHILPPLKRQDQVNSEKSSVVVQRTPVPPEHLYASGSIDRSRTSSWATKHNVTNGNKNKRRASRPSIPTTSKKMSSSRYSFPPSEKKARITSTRDPSSFEYSNNSGDEPRIHLPKSSMRSNLQIKPMPQSSSEHERILPESDRLFSPSGRISQSHKNTPSPQRVFRPSLHMSNAPVMKKNLLSYTESSKTNSPSSQLVHCSVESGLAPVSAIVSQVASQADLSATSPQSSVYDQPSKLTSTIGKVKIVRSSTSKQVVQPVKAASLLKQNIKPASDTNASERPQSTVLTSKSTNSVEPKESLNQAMVMQRPPASDAVKAVKRLPIHPSVAIPTFSVPPNLARPTYVKSFKDLEKEAAAYNTNHALSDGSSPKINTLPQEVTHSSTALTSSNSQDNDFTYVTAGTTVKGTTNTTSTSVLSIASTATADKLSTSNKPPSVQISSANIIKVSPRPLSVAKGVPIVTQLSGARITKTFSQVTGSSKPSIIVVHRPPGRKSLTTAPAKFLEIEGPVKHISRVKTITSMSRPVTMSPSLIKPTTVKVTEESSKSSGDAGLPSTCIHKVITKGKMRQLVLKPTTTNPPQILQPAKSDTSTLALGKTKTDKEISPRLNPQEKTKSAPPIQAASTMQALMAMHKGAGTSPQSSSFSRVLECSPSAGTTFSHNVINRPQLVPKSTLIQPAPTTTTLHQGHRLTVIKSKPKPTPDYSSYNFEDEEE